VLFPFFRRKPDPPPLEVPHGVPFAVTDELISCEGVSVCFGKGSSRSPAIRDVSFSVFPGEFVCVMGPSGCGKSTVLNVLAGFMPPTEGRVLLNHAEIRGVDRHRGVVFQKPPLFEWFSVRKNIAFGPKMRGLPKDEIARLTDLFLERVGLEDAADRMVYELSGGMRQRVAIARSLINDPEILLMDEPFGALDALTREQMQDLVRRIWWNTRKTIFFITHDVDEALKLATRVLVMSRSPGTITMDVPSGFSREYAEGSDDRIWFSDEFYRTRREILDLITGRDGSAVDLRNWQGVRPDGAPGPDCPAESGGTGRAAGAGGPGRASGAGGSYGQAGPDSPYLDVSAGADVPGLSEKEGNVGGAWAGWPGSGSERTVA
jgi:taurine transport system ATP-binding protein